MIVRFVAVVAKPKQTHAQPDREAACVYCVYDENRCVDALVLLKRVSLSLLSVFVAGVSVLVQMQVLAVFASVRVLVCECLSVFAPVSVIVSVSVRLSVFVSVRVYSKPERSVRGA